MHTTGRRLKTSIMLGEDEGNAWGKHTQTIGGNGIIITSNNKVQANEAIIRVQSPVVSAMGKSSLVIREVEISQAMRSSVRS